MRLRAPEKSAPNSKVKKRKGAAKKRKMETSPLRMNLTLNYAKILTSSNTVVSISTQRILDRDLTNYRFGGEKSNLFCYGFELAF